MKVCVLVTNFGEPWDEGGKNNVRSLTDHLGGRWSFSFLGLGPADREFEYRGYPVRIVRTPAFDRLAGRLLAPLGLLRLLCEGRSFVRRAEPDLVFSYLETASACLVSAALRRLAAPRARLVHTVWNDWYAPRRAPALAWLSEHLPNVVLNNALVARIGLATSDDVLATSAYLLDRVRGLGIEDALLTPTGVDTTRFVPRRPIRAAAPLVIGYLGHLTHAKGVSDLISAIVPLLEPMDASLRFAVTGGEEAHLLASLSSPRVRIQGLTDPVEFFNDVDLVVVPRRSSYGAVSYPNTVLEAMACGRTVVSTALPGIDELIRDGEDGYLVPPGDPAALKHRVATLLRSPEALARTGRRARERVLESFSWEALAVRVAEVVEARFGPGRSHPGQKTAPE